MKLALRNPGASEQSISPSISARQSCPLCGDPRLNITPLIKSLHPKDKVIHLP